MSLSLETLSRIASKLAEKPVKIRLRAPCVSGVKGLCMPHLGGAVIDLDPSLTPEGQYWHLLHESAHCRSLAPNQKYNPWVDKEPGYFRLVTKDLSYPVIQEEAAANKQAEIWNDWAEDWAPYYPGATPEEKKLRALLNWAPNMKSLTEIINQGARRGAEAAIKAYNLRR